MVIFPSGSPLPGRPRAFDAPHFYSAILLIFFPSLLVSIFFWRVALIPPFLRLQYMRGRPDLDPTEIFHDLSFGFPPLSSLAWRSRSQGSFLIFVEILDIDFSVLLLFD